VCAALTIAQARAAAQLVPHDDWYTIETKNFRVHFAKSLEPEDDERQ
jgi:hypothetical protein